MKILFVCLANICRSPAAAEILREKLKAYPHIAADYQIGSCGISDWFLGCLPAEQMQRAAKKRGLTLRSRAKGFHAEYFEQYDLIFAADHTIQDHLSKLAPPSFDSSKILLMTSFSKKYKDLDVPDPYGKEDAAFEETIDLIEESCEGIAEYLLRLI